MCGILLHFNSEQTFGRAHKESLNSGSLENLGDLENSISELPSSSKTSLSGSISPIFNVLVPEILARGSDYSQYYCQPHLELFSSVLSLRQPLTKQPFIKDDRFIIQFNGELYNDEIPLHSNDLEFIYKRLQDYNGDIIKTIGSLHGGFAYSIIDLTNSKVYFGKDILGKKSLAYSLIEGTGELFISSCFPEEDNQTTFFKECLNAVVYVFDMNKRSIGMLRYEDSADLPDKLAVNNRWLTDDDPSEEFLVSELHKELTEAVRRRVETIFPVHNSKSKFAILFSGGIDCTLLAALCAEILEGPVTIDLLNVSFDNPRTKTDPSQTPDRRLARKSWSHLEERYRNSQIKFHLVEIDVPYESYLKHKQKVVNLIRPNDTAMDLSIAIAFYFAASGMGKDSISECKVLLSGLGADELFAGYTRHERIFTGISNQVRRQLKQKPVKDATVYKMNELVNKLRQELQYDLSNLYIRNLSRDDKVISCWSKEIRYPYLDYDFMRFVTSKVPLSSKLHYDDQTGEIVRKYLLRLLARKMGLDWVAEEPKRAIQFGARSAKMEEGAGKMKGTDKIY
ncbi:hypothetical protein FOA43_002847 [Brettanomyces nanus]|uniref:Asparagine synthase (glutamine-hydrolyzing) n=1 Tax=Eeniella nana TaxID=13502 RepID=A0A875S661_EENNA|nr:uncharacterized protein FOA43_002847 [Brettanomyces nanus]QPG75492.1 hypothetical protein FOA43_002847 [Brettanomyces nanus]